MTGGLFRQLPEPLPNQKRFATLDCPALFRLPSKTFRPSNAEQKRRARCFRIEGSGNAPYAGHPEEMGFTSQERVMHRAIFVMDQSFFNLGCFYRVDVRSRSGRLIETHYVELREIAWC